MAGNLGAEELSQISGELERAVRAGADQAVRELLPAFGDRLAQALASMENLLAQAGTDPEEGAAGPDPAPAALDPDTVRPLLDRLGQALDADLSEAQEVAAGLAPLVRGTPLAGAFARLTDALAEFDTDAAAGAVREMTTNLART